jgi:hypothetical protein
MKHYLLRIAPIPSRDNAEIAAFLSARDGINCLYEDSHEQHYRIKSSESPTEMRAMFPVFKFAKVYFHELSGGDIGEVNRLALCECQKTRMDAFKKWLDDHRAKFDWR